MKANVENNLKKKEPLKCHMIIIFFLYINFVPLFSRKDEKILDF